MDKSGIPPRRAALWLMDQVIFDSRLLSELLAAGALEKLPNADKARAQRLATDGLRFVGRADRILDKFMKKPPNGSVRNILRLATVEICNGAAPHGVVNDWVEICTRGKKTHGMKGLVNAVLRKVAESGPAMWPKMGVSRMPRWLRDPLVEAWGAQPVAAMEQAHEKGAPLDLSLRAEDADLAQTLGAKRLPNGSLRLENPGQVSALPGFKKGAWWVQDAAAAMAAQILDVQPGEQVLDLCAAPGGKTLQLAAAGADVHAVDLSDARLTRLRENLKRTGLKAKVDAADVLEMKLPAADAILLDAPCSATGTLRRHPDLPFAKDGSEFGGLIDLQSQMLDHVVDQMKPGARLVYCTCSLLPDEGEVQIEELLARTPGLRMDTDALMLPGIKPNWITEEGGLRLRPDYWADKGGMDGFYMALIRKV